MDGTVLRFGELKGSGTMIEQVKGFSYSVSSLLGASSLLPVITEGDMHKESSEQQGNLKEKNKKSWWRFSLASPKIRDTVSAWYSHTNMFPFFPLYVNVLNFRCKTDMNYY